MGLKKIKAVPEFFGSPLTSVYVNKTIDPPRRKTFIKSGITKILALLILAIIGFIKMQKIIFLYCRRLLQVPISLKFIHIQWVMGILIVR